MSETTCRCGDLDAIHQLKARYCRFLDTKDEQGWRTVFADDLVVLLDLAVSVGGKDPQTAPEITGADNFVPGVLKSLEGAATVHHCHTPEITFQSETTASGIWAMEDHLVYSDGREMFGAGHYHETYEKSDGVWRIKTLHMTRTFQRLIGDLPTAAPDHLTGTS
ncbi:MAG: nuclear transport factor 2 family protein [Nocardia sp.]|nr:nuclear transport factor 2 family protein [Nocardia sp.]